MRGLDLGGSAGGVDHIVMALIAKEIGLDPSKLNYIPMTRAESVTAVGGGAVVLAVSGGVSEFSAMAEAGRIKIIAGHLRRPLTASTPPA